MHLNVLKELCFAAEKNLRVVGKTFPYLIGCLALFACLIPGIVSASTNIPQVTVLIYHRFGEETLPSTNVSMENFKEQMAYLLANGYQVIPLSNLVDSLADKKMLPDKAVVITIDDAYHSVYENAWPVLRSFGFPFTVFVYVKGVDQHYPGYMTWEQLKEMKTSGVDIQDHGYSHERMVDKADGFDEIGYRSWFSADLVKSSRLMMSNLGSRPRFFALPYGEYNVQSIEEAKKLGYDAVLTQDPGSVSQYTNPYMIPREPILGKDWSKLSHFETVLKRVDLPISEMDPPFGNFEGVPDTFAARVLFPARYLQSSFKIYVSELGWMSPVIEGSLVKVNNETRLARRVNRVMLKAKEKETGRTALRSWLLVQD